MPLLQFQQFFDGIQKVFFQERRITLVIKFNLSKLDANGCIRHGDPL